MDKFGEKLRELREELGLNQAQFGKLLKTTQRNISYWEKGKSEPDYETLKFIATKFNLTTDFLLGLEDEHGKKVNVNNSFNNFSGNGNNIKF